MKVNSCMLGFLILVLCSDIQVHSQTLTTLANFNGTNGSEPSATLTLDGDDNIYGTTLTGGNGDGTVFKLTANGVLTTLVSFNGTNGANPQQPLILLNNKLYGAAGNYTGGSLFSVDTNGSNFTNLFDFGVSNTFSGPNGLILCGDTFYGTASTGGSLNGTGEGGVFSINVDGSNFTSMFVFDGIDGGRTQGGLERFN